MNELLLPIGLLIAGIVLVLIFTTRKNKKVNFIPKVKPNFTSDPTPEQQEADLKEAQLSALSKAESEKLATSTSAKKPRAKKTEDEGKKSEPKKSLARKAPKKQ